MPFIYRMSGNIRQLCVKAVIKKARISKRGLCMLSGEHCRAGAGMGRKCHIPFFLPGWSYCWQ